MSTLRSQRPTVLVVEDEGPIRRFVRTVLRSHGYVVLEASNGEQALALFRARAPHIQLAVIDLMMPGMGGMDLSSRLAPYENVKVLFISGMRDSVALESLAQGAPKQVLRKPFNADQLLGRIRDLLESSPEPVCE